jgi:3-dehydroquinate synthetase/ABC-type branched-subunit amino acid transport system ATPase component
MTSPSALFARNEIHIEILHPEPRVVLSGSETGASFVLPTPGIYSLSGPNQSGKTFLIKYLIGVAPVAYKKGFAEANTYIDGKPRRIRNSADALRYGVAAVFHEDPLIPTMTVRQQLLMRHTASRLGVLGATVWEWFHGGLIQPIYRTLFPESLLMEKIPIEDLFYAEKDLVATAQEWLDEFGFSDIMDKYPSELSTGGLAVARLLQSLMQRRLRVLFLDEALSGVADDKWPGIVAVVTRWQERTNAAIVVVTHNREELLRWSPSVRYRIRDATIQREDASPASFVVPSIPQRIAEYPVFEHSESDTTMWASLVSGRRVVAIRDNGIASSRAWKDILNSLRLHAASDVEVVGFQPSESSKTVETALKLFVDVLKHVGSTNMAIVVVGGGITLNVAGLAAAALYKGVARLILVPSTVMAIADVAVGSKMAVNVMEKGGSASRTQVWKHAFGVYANPFAVVLDRRLLDSLGLQECRRGLSECVKHGLLQNSTLFDEALALVNDSVPSRQRLYDVATRVLRLKARLLVHDPWEIGVGQLLLFGHMHAHALERCSGFAIPHGSSVFFGMLVELLCGAEATEGRLYSNILAVIQRHRVDLCQGWSGLSVDALMSAYQTDVRYRAASCTTIIVASAGVYSDPVTARVHSIEVPWRNVRSAVEQLIRDLG